MSQTFTLEDIIKYVLRCYTKKELNEKINTWKNNEVIFNIYDVTRCGYRYKLSINDPTLVIDNIGKEDVLRRYIVNYGIVNSIAKAYEDAEMDKILTYRFQIDGRNVVLVGIYDIFLPREEEVVLVRHVKELKDGKPKKHHVEQALILQWLAYKNKVLVTPRILYYIGFGKEFREFVIETAIAHSNSFANEFEERLKERIKLVLDSEGPFYSWECGVCPYKDICSKQNKEVKKINDIVSEGEWLWYEDLLLTRTMKFIKKLIEKDIEYAEFSERDSGDSVISLRINVTKLTRCPIEFWFSKLVPYTTILSNLKKRVLRGNIIHNGIAYIVSRFNEVKQFCGEELNLCIQEVEVEKKLSKKFSLGRYSIEINGRADIVLTYRDTDTKNIVIEVKTAEDTRVKPYHEEQLKIYLNMLKNSVGRLVYVVEVRDVNKKKRLEFNDIAINKPVDDSYIENKVIDIINARRGLIDISRIPKSLCEICEFRDLCHVKTLVNQGTLQTT